jgi:hypothetical protein
MDIPINWFAVVVAAIAHFIIGFLWYSVFFMKPWMQEMGLGKLTPKQRKEGMKDMPKNMVINFITLLVTAWVLNAIVQFAGNFFHMQGFFHGVKTGFFVWLGFFATTLVNQVLWEKRSWKLYAINASHHLAGLVAMGVILACWM